MANAHRRAKTQGHGSLITPFTPTLKQVLSETSLNLILFKTSQISVLN